MKKETKYLLKDITFIRDRDGVITPYIENEKQTKFKNILTNYYVRKHKNSQFITTRYNLDHCRAYSAQDLLVLLGHHHAMSLVCSKLYRHYIDNPATNFEKFSMRVPVKVDEIAGTCKYAGYLINCEEKKKAKETQKRLQTQQETEQAINTAHELTRF